MEIMIIIMVNYCLCITIILVVIVVAIIIIILIIMLAPLGPRPGLHGRTQVSSSAHTQVSSCSYLWVPGLAFMAEGLVDRLLCAVKEAAPLQKVQDGREKDDGYAHEKHQHPINI